MTIKVSRAVLGHGVLTGISRRHLADLVVELAAPWQAVVEGRRDAARGGARQRAAGAGARHRLVFVDRVIATLIHLRHDLPHAVLGLLFGVDRSTISQRIPLEHVLADHKRWKDLARQTHRQDTLPATYLAIAYLISDRTATT